MREKEYYNNSWNYKDRKKKKSKAELNMLKRLSDYDKNKYCKYM